MRTKAWRRQQEFKKKKNVVYHNWFSWFERTPRIIGKKAHSPKMCSCWMCGNPRKYFNEKTIQEKRNEIVLGTTRGN